MGVDEEFICAKKIRGKPFFEKETKTGTLAQQTLRKDSTTWQMDELP